MGALTLRERDERLELAEVWPLHATASFAVLCGLLDRQAVTFRGDDLLEFRLDDGARAVYRIVERATIRPDPMLTLRLEYGEPAERIEAPS
jgi:hypothetical protein